MPAPGTITRAVLSGKKSGSLNPFSKKRNMILISDNQSDFYLNGQGSLMR